MGSCSLNRKGIFLFKNMLWKFGKDGQGALGNQLLLSLGKHNKTLVFASLGMPPPLQKEGGLDLHKLNSWFIFI